MKEQVYQPVQRRVIPFLSILFVLMLAFSGHSFAQDKIAISSLQKDTSSAVWHKLKTIGSVTISYQYVDCGPVEYMMFKIDNASSDKQEVSWKFKHFNGGDEKQVNADDANVKYTVNANSSVSGACYSENTRLGVFVRESGMVLIVTDIELTGITVSIAQ